MSASNWQTTIPPKPKPTVTADADTLLGQLQQISENTAPIPQVQNPFGPNSAGFPQMGWPIYLPNGGLLDFYTENSVSPVPQESLEILYIDTNGALHAVSPEPDVLAEQTNRSPTQTFFTLPACYLMAVFVDYNSTSTNLKRGQYFITCYLSVHAQTGTSAAFVLFADYVTRLSQVCWPNGRNISSTEGPGYIYDPKPSNPVAGADIALAVPTGARWKVRAFAADLVGDGAGSPRTVQLKITDPTPKTTYVSAPGPSQAVGATESYYGVPGYGLAADAAFTALTARIQLPQDLILAAGWTINTLTTNIDASDQWQNIQLEVEEWLEP